MGSAMHCGNDNSSPGSPFAHPPPLSGSDGAALQLVMECAGHCGVEVEFLLHVGQVHLIIRLDIAVAPYL